jgi:thioredoxin 1
MKVYKFYAEWCQPCKMLSKVIEDAKDKIDPSVELIEFDIDAEMMTAVNYNVRGVPTMVIVDDAGKEIKRQSGYMNEEKLLDFLKV